MGNQLTFEMEVGLHPFGLSAAEDAVNSGLAAHRIATTRLPKALCAQVSVLRTLHTRTTVSVGVCH